MRRTGRSRSDGGFALIAVMGVMVLLLAMGASLHTGSLADTTLRGAHQIATAGFYAAEAGVNRGMGTYRDIFLSYSVPSGSDFDENSFSLGPRTVRYQLAPVTGYETGQTEPVPSGRSFEGLTAIRYKYTANSESELHAGDTEVTLGTEFDIDYVPLFQFLAFYANDLEMLPGPNMNLHGPIHSNGSIYLNAGNTFRIVDCGPSYSDPNYCSTAIPTVHVSAAGEIYRGRKDSNSCTGTVRISKLADGNHDGLLDTKDVTCASSTASAAALSSSQIAEWMGSLSSHKQQVTVPTPDVFTMGSGQWWHDADLRIALDLSDDSDSKRFPIKVLNSGGTLDATATAKLQAFMAAREGRLFYNQVPKTDTVGTYTSGANPTCSPSNSHCKKDNYEDAFGNDYEVYRCFRSDYSTPSCETGFVSNVDLGSGTELPAGYKTARRGGFYNNREHAWVAMLNLNLHDFLRWNRTFAGSDQLVDPDDTSDGGLVIYLTVVGLLSGSMPATGERVRYGVRVFGSYDLDFSATADPTGVTVVSDQAIYIEGDYNVGDGTHPKMPAAFMGDTINVLSSGWSSTLNSRNDYQSAKGLSARPANASGTTTTLNAAFIAGVDNTTTGNYNGGFENYPRFHEDWSGRTLRYRGSFVSLGNPLHNRGAWCGTGSGCNIYNPPTRNWDFDTDFSNAALLPPATPRAVTVEQILFTENFR